MLRPLLLLSIAVTACAQQPAAVPSARTSPYFNAAALDFGALVPPPPRDGSQAGREDLAAVLEAQRTRTAAQVAAAQYDDQHEDIFLFSTVLGPHFNPNELPRAAELSRRLREASGVVNPQLKVRYGRPRPFRASAQVHPVCEQTASNSYPSGHTMVGTLEALALAQMVPEQEAAIAERLEQYMHNRIVCGVHYPTDTQASRTIATALFGLISASPAFQADLAAAKAELRARLGLDNPSVVAAAGR